MEPRCAVHLHKVAELPVFSQPSKKLRAQQCFDILLDPQLLRESICSRVPFSVNCNALFVVDLDRLQAAKDIVVDDMGVWQWKGSYRVWGSVEYGVVVTAGKHRPDSEHVYQLWQRYYENKTSPDVKKYVVLLQGERCMHVVFLYV